VGSVGAEVASHRTMLSVMVQTLPPKKDVALALLDGAPTVFVHLDARREGVQVPDHLRDRPQLILRVGYSLTPPININVDDSGITCTLSFNRSFYACVLPWSAIFGMVGDDGRAMLWPDDIPPEVEKMFPPPSGPTAAPGKPAAAKKNGPRRVPRAKDGPTPAAASPGGVPEARRDVRQRLVSVSTGESKPPETPDPSSPPETPAPDGQRKPKRELPPYLRVIK